MSSDPSQAPAQARPVRRKPKSPRKLLLKKLLLLGTTLFILFVAIELAFRAYFAMRVGPDVWLYGTPFSQAQAKFDPIGARVRRMSKIKTTAFHDNEFENYSKYFPNQKRVDKDRAGNTFEVTINSEGFRGEEFTIQKPPGTVRVLTLGASSTFGFGDRDHETYPVYLEQMLNEALPELRERNPSYASVREFEVINLGIPHLTTSNIYSLFMAEGLRLEPDFVTFYEGINDAAYRPPVSEAAQKTKKAVKSIPLVKPIIRELRWRFLTVALLNMSVSNYMVDAFSEEDIDKGRIGRHDDVVGHLQLIHDECELLGVQFILANQQAKSLSIEEDEIRGVSYADEQARVRRKLAETDELTSFEMYFLLHGELMDGVRALAEERQIPFVDAIQALDGRRDCLTTWVHLTPEANRLLAAAFAEVILKQAAIRPIGGDLARRVETP